MKKNKFFQFCIVLISFLLMGNSQADKGVIKLKDFPETSILIESLTLHSPNEMNEIVLLPISNFDQKEAANIISRIERLPESLLKKINQNGVVVQLFTGKLTDNKSAIHLSGIVPRGYVSKTTWDNVPGLGGSKTVLVKIGSSNKGSGHGSINLELHELAHSIDRQVYSGLRYKEQYLSIWEKEKYKLFPGNDYFINYPEEYFAECFAYYYMGGKYRATLREKAPLTFEFIKKLS